MALRIAGRLTTNPRDVREFLDAKKSRREPVRLKASRGGMATQHPKSQLEFRQLWNTLRLNPDLSAAADKLDRIEHDLRLRGVTMPCPDEVTQAPSRAGPAVILNWGGVSCVLSKDNFISLVGGTSGLQANKVTREFLDALQQKALAQSCLMTQH